MLAYVNRKMQFYQYRKQMKAKKLESTSNNTSFSIELVDEQNLLQIAISDLKNTSVANINALSLPNKNNLNLKKLYYELFCQYIHQRKISQWLTLVSPNKLRISFTYPKCQLKELTFQCTTISYEEQNAKKMQILFNQQQAKIQKIYEDMRIKIQLLASNKTLEVQQKLQGIAAEVVNKLQEDSQTMIRQFTDHYNSIKELSEIENQQRLQTSVKKVIQSNSLMLEEFDMIKISLQKQMAVLSNDIEQQRQLIENIEKDIDWNKDQFEDKQQALKESFEEKISLLQKIINQLINQGFTINNKETIKYQQNHNHNRPPQTQQVIFKCQENMSQIKSIQQIINQSDQHASLHEVKTKKRSSLVSYNMNQLFDAP